MKARALEITELVGGYGGKTVLRGVSVSVDRGEIVVVIGPNGAGKSTLLRAIFGLVRVEHGTICFFNKHIENRPPSENVRAGLAYVPQGNRVFGSLTVAENLEVAAGVSSASAHASDRIAAVLAQFPILRDRLRQTAGTLSGGEKQMLAIARALVVQPHMLLLDEPTLGLAPQASKSLFGVIQKIRAEGISILMVEQRVREALAVADRGYVLKLGQCVGSGSSQELASSDLAAGFLGA